jgi:hypothetical protein
VVAEGGGGGRKTLSKVEKKVSQAGLPMTACTPPEALPTHR